MSRIIPSDKLGYVQGLAVSVFDFDIAGAVGSFVFGILADNHGMMTTAISQMAALVNAPLMSHPLLGPAKKKNWMMKRVLLIPQKTLH
jgi:predicted MFS family arabinose efflux permease